MREYFCAYHSMLRGMRRLSDAECGRLFRALLEYSQSGTEPINLQGREEALFDVYADQIDREIEKYRATCESNRRNVSKRYATNATTGNDRIRPYTNATTVYDGYQNKDKDKGEEEDKGKGKDKDKEEGESARACARETPPTVSMVMDYAREIGADGFDADTFVNYHSQNGWLIRGSPMQDWRASVRLWVARDREREKTNPALQYQQREYKEQDSESFFIDLEKEYGNEQLR